MNPNLENNIIVKKINNDVKHINDFVLDNNEGTKKMRQKFYNQAVKQRNEYVEREISNFKTIKRNIVEEIQKRFSRILERDKTSIYEKDLSKVEEALELLKLSLNTSTSYKLKLDNCIAYVDNDIFLEDMNKEIDKFIHYFEDYGIKLTVNDFQYTMFTEEYMKAFFDKKDIKSTFEKIYFSCPDIKMQLKLNLRDIVKKYDKKLNKYLNYHKEELYKKAKVNDNTIVDYYVKERVKLGTEVAKDPYNNTMKFIRGDLKIEDYLKNSPTRIKNFNQFTPNNNYEYYNEKEKEEYDSAMMSLYLNLSVLRKYYKYEFIIEDLIKRFKNKETALSEYNTKKKETEKLEAERRIIYQRYKKACGKGLFSKYNESKIKLTKVKMNEVLKEIDVAYKELNDLEITTHLEKINESSSITDLLKVSLLSFPYLEKQLEDHEEFKDYTLEDSIDEYYRFLYNPNNEFLRKINVFLDYDIAHVVTEKFKLLKLNILEEQIQKNNLDSTLSTIEFINTIQNVESSTISFEEINRYCEMNSIIENNKESNEII